MTFAIRNWTKFQHFKDRKPPWVKLYHDLLDNWQWFALPPVASKCLVMLWLVASESDGDLPDTASLAWRLRMSERDLDDAIQALVQAEFIIVRDDSIESDGLNTTAKTIAKKNNFGSRYIPDATKAEVMERDNGLCQSCGATEKLEFDHIHPVSKGGESIPENLQILCRSCNRKKRTNSATPSVASGLRQAELPGCAKRSLETETETETETEGEAYSLSKNPAQPEAEEAKPDAKMEDVMAAWNIAATENGLHICRFLSPGRKKALRERLRDKDWRSHYEDALTRLRGIRWVRGSTKGAWVASIDWFLRPDTLTKILEGTYDDNRTDFSTPSPDDSAGLF